MKQPGPATWRQCTTNTSHTTLVKPLLVNNSMRRTNPKIQLGSISLGYLTLDVPYLFNFPKFNIKYQVNIMLEKLHIILHIYIFIMYYIHVWGEGKVTVQVLCWTSRASFPPDPDLWISSFRGYVHVLQVCHLQQGHLWKGLKNLTNSTKTIGPKWMKTMG